MKPFSTTLFASALAVFAASGAVCTPAFAASNDGAPKAEHLKTDDGVIRVKSAYGVAETVARLKADIAAKGIKFFDEIDQQKLAADAGVKFDAFGRDVGLQPRHGFGNAIGAFHADHAI